MKLTDSTEIKGVVKAPPSKSVAQRAIAIASITNGVSEILNAGDSDDVKSVIRVCKSLGADIQNIDNKLIIRGGIKTPSIPLDCGESGLCIRMFAPIVATLSDKIVLTGCGTLKNRTMVMLENSIKALGVNCHSTNGFIPITVQGGYKNEFVKIDCSQSSQVLTGILIAAPLLKNDLTIEVENLKSKPYIDLTSEVMHYFGVTVKNQNYQKFIIKKTECYRPAKINVEGDWSGAAFMLVAGAIAGEIRVENLNLKSKQADIAILDVLSKTGANILLNDNSVTVSKNKLECFEFDVTDCPDLFPPLFVLAVYCKGNSIISGIERLKHKESDRVFSLCREFSKLGIKTQIFENHIIIKGSQPSLGVVESHNDHRVAMALAIASLQSTGKIEIKGTEVVNKSYPGFFRDLACIIH